MTHEPHLAVVDQQLGADLEHPQHLRMGQLDALAVAEGRIVVQAEDLARRDRTSTAHERAQAELRALQVGQHRQRPVDPGLGRAHVLQGGAVVRVRSVTEVQAEDIDARARERLHPFRPAAGGAQGGDDVRAALADHARRLARLASFR